MLREAMITDCEGCRGKKQLPSIKRKWAHCDDHFAIHTSIKLLWWTPNTKITSCICCTSTEQRKQRRNERLWPSPACLQSCVCSCYLSWAHSAPNHSWFSDTKNLRPSPASWTRIWGMIHCLIPHSRSKSWILCFTPTCLYATRVLAALCQYSRGQHFLT